MSVEGEKAASNAPPRPSLPLSAPLGPGVAILRAGGASLALPFPPPQMKKKLNIFTLIIKGVYFVVNESNNPETYRAKNSSSLP